MNRTPDVELGLRDYFADDGLTAPDYVLDVVEERIRRQPRRPAGRLRRRFRPVTRTITYAAALAAVLIVLVVGYNLLPRQSSFGGPSPATSPTLTTPPSLRPSLTSGSTPMALHDGPLAGGRYLLRPFSDLPSV